jgi:hypothetical protein
MKKNLRFALICLILPLSVVLFHAESKLTISADGHILAQALILLGAYWLVWCWLKFEEDCHMREYIESSSTTPGQRWPTRTTTFGK